MYVNEFRCHRLAQCDCCAHGKTWADPLLNPEHHLQDQFPVNLHSLSSIRPSLGNQIVRYFKSITWGSDSLQAEGAVHWSPAEQIHSIQVLTERRSLMKNPIRTVQDSTWGLQQVQILLFAVRSINQQSQTSPQ